MLWLPPAPFSAAPLLPRCAHIPRPPPRSPMPPHQVWVPRLSTTGLPQATLVLTCFPICWHRRSVSAGPCCHHLGAKLCLGSFRDFPSQGGKRSLKSSRNPCSSLSPQPQLPLEGQVLGGHLVHVPAFRGTVCLQGSDTHPPLYSNQCLLRNELRDANTVNLTSSRAHRTKHSISLSPCRSGPLLTGPTLSPSSQPNPRRCLL